MTNFERLRSSKEDMKQLIYIDINLYFEVKDSELFGGVGTTGYTSIKLGGVGYIEKITDDYVKAQIEIAAKMCKVPKESIKLIFKEEYDSQTEEDEDFDYEDD